MKRNDTQKKTCTKCGRELPTGYEGSECLACKGKDAELLKSVLAGVATIAFAVVTAGKFLGGRFKK